MRIYLMCAAVIGCATGCTAAVGGDTDLEANDPKRVAPSETNVTSGTESECGCVEDAPLPSSGSATVTEPTKPVTPTPVIVRVGSAAVPLCADDITGNPSLSRIAVSNPGSSFTGGFKGDQDGAGGVNLFLTSYPVVKIYKTEDVLAHRGGAYRVIDDPVVGQAIKRDMASRTFQLSVPDLPAGSYLVALCASEAKDRCEMTYTYQDAERESDDRGYDEPWQAFFNLNNKEGAGRFGFIAGSDRPLVVSATQATGGNLMVLWSKNDGKSWEGICQGDGHGGSGTISPLVLDLGGNAAMSSREEGVLFDLSDGSGARRISWPTSRDTYVLALDRNGNGNIDDGRELFGNYTTLAHSGYRAANGFEALAQYDVNHDGVIDARDPVYAEIVAWSDRVTRNGRIDEGESFHLADLGVRSIDLDYAGGSEKDPYGNVVGQRASVGLSFGAFAPRTSQPAQVKDIWFAW